MTIENIDTPPEGPMTIDQLLDQVAPVEDKPEDQEEAVETAEEETEAEAEEESTTDDAEPEAEEEEPEVYSVDEYGEIAISLRDGTQTTLSELEQGYHRQADYTRKSQANADERKALERERAELAEERRQLHEQYASFEEPEPDWRALAEEDPLGWQLKRFEWEKKQQEKAAEKKAAEDAQAEQARQYLNQSAQIALQVMPEWRDVQKMRETAPARREAGIRNGWTPEQIDQEMNNPSDLRLHVLLEKAARYDAGEVKKTAALKKIAKAPKVVKPGTSVSKADKEAAERAAQRKARSKPMSAEDYLNTFTFD